MRSGFKFPLALLHFAVPGKPHLDEELDTEASIGEEGVQLVAKTCQIAQIVKDQQIEVEINHSKTYDFLQKGEVS